MPETPTLKMNLSEMLAHVGSMDADELVSTAFRLEIPMHWKGDARRVTGIFKPQDEPARCARLSDGTYAALDPAEPSDFGADLDYALKAAVRAKGAELEVGRLRDLVQKLVNALDQCHKQMDALNDGGFGPLTKLDDINAMLHAADALSLAKDQGFEPTAIRSGSRKEQ